MRRGVQNFIDVVAVIPMYGAGFFVWMFGMYAQVIPWSTTPYNFRWLLLPPMVMPIVYLAWLGARRWYPTRDPNRFRRLLHFLIALVLAGVVSAVEFTWNTGMGTKYLSTVLALALMLAVALLALVVDRNVEMSLRIVLFTMFAVVPVVALGRVAASVAAEIRYTLARLVGSAF